MDRGDTECCQWMNWLLFVLCVQNTLMDDYTHYVPGTFPPWWTIQKRGMWRLNGLMNGATLACVLARVGSRCNGAYYTVIATYWLALHNQPKMAPCLLCWQRKVKAALCRQRSATNYTMIQLYWAVAEYYVTWSVGLIPLVYMVSTCNSKGSTPSFKGAV